jgi:hypothetical protein
MYKNTLGMVFFETLILIVQTLNNLSTYENVTRYIIFDLLIHWNMSKIQK